MDSLKCTILVNYNGDLLYFAKKWYLYKNSKLYELQKSYLNASLAYRIIGGNKFYYRTKMIKLAQKCNIILNNNIPF